MKHKEDYRATDIPRLGATRSPRYVAVRVLGYTVATVLCSLLLIPVAELSAINVGVLVTLGIVFIAYSLRFWRLASRGVPSNPMRVFHFSIVYLGVLFLFLTIDPFLPL